MARDLKRKLVVEGLLKVDNSGFSNLVFSSLVKGASLNSADRAFVAKVFYGTIERKITLNYILSQFISKPLSKLDKEVLAILQSGLYQIIYMNSVPAFAAINQAVELCPSFKKTSAKGLVNAVLRKAGNFDIKQRKFANERERICVMYSVSKEIADIIMTDYPDNYENILSAMFSLPSLTINVNTVKIPTDCFKALLKESDVEYHTTPVENCLRITSSGAITSIPGFEEGYFFVQGISSQYAVKASGIKKGDKVLDLCAAPGGKSFAASIIMDNTGSIISCDPNSSRLALIEDSAARMGLKNIFTLENLGENYRRCLRGQDVVICDVPCSGIGIIPKKPDLRYKNMDKLEDLYKVQYEILKTGAEYVKNGGRIVYSTCTINKKENQEQIKKFLAERNDFRLVKQDCPVKGTINDDDMVTFLPDGDICDGFFIAILEKV